MNYSFLKSEKAPKILVEAYKLLGTKELLGKDNNPKILAWAEKLGLKKPILPMKFLGVVCLLLMYV